MTACREADCRVASLLAMTRLGGGTFNLVIARLRRSRGNLRAATDGRFRLNDTSQRLPRRLRLLAMTEEIEARAQTIDHICHCEAPQGPWQSVPCAGSARKNELPKERIATSAYGLLAMTRLGDADCHGWGVRPNGFSLPTVYHTACGAAKVFSRRQISSLHPGAFTLK